MENHRRRSVRCPYCRSLITTKHGTRLLVQVRVRGSGKRRVQRYHCMACERTFSTRREWKKKYSLQFKMHIAKQHVEERRSYRVIAKRLAEETGKHIAPRVLCTWVNEIASRCKSSITVQHTYQPQWEGYLTVDDKYINVKGTKMFNLVAVDSSGDPLYVRMYREKTLEKYREFLHTIITELHYPVRAVISDLDPLLVRALGEEVPSPIPHQLCLWHAMEEVKRMIDYATVARKHAVLSKKIEDFRAALMDHKPYYNTAPCEQWEKALAKLQPLYERHRTMLRALTAILFARAAADAQDAFKQFRSRYAEYPQVIAWVAARWNGLCAHQKDHRIARTNVLAENLNKQLMRRLKTVEAFQSFRTAYNYVQLLTLYLRFKPYTDCRGSRKLRNGKTPLEVCNVHLAHHDWIKHAVECP